MNSQSADTKDELADDITEAEIEKLIAEAIEDGATGCEVVTENNKRFLVCHYPPV